MVPTPLSIGLTLCQSIIIEEGTRNLTLVGSFYDFEASEFPFTPAPFRAIASLVGGNGEGELVLTITQLRTDDEVFAIHRRISFVDRFDEVCVMSRLTNCEFPEPGAYMMTLLVDGEWVAQRRFEVSSEETF